LTSWFKSKQQIFSTSTLQAADIKATEGHSSNALTFIKGLLPDGGPLSYSPHTKMKVFLISEQLFLMMIKILML
jgi:hypothetical protein